ncbi:MAG: hypothetical protein V7711_05400 [Pseudomonadales bacterium]
MTEKTKNGIANLTFTFGLMLAGMTFINAAHASDLDANRFQWNTLTYSATKFLMSLDTHVHFERSAAETASAELLSVPEGDAVMPAASEVMKFTLSTEIMGRHTETSLWMNPDATVLQRNTVRTGKKERFKALRFLPDSVYTSRSRPANKGEEGTPYSQWTNTSGNYDEIAAAEQDLPLTKAESLFYLVAASDLAKVGDTLIAYVYEEEGTVQVQLKVEEQVSLKASFIEHSSEGDRKLSEKIDTLRIRVSASPYADNTSGAEFEFLGYKGDIDLFLDPQRNVVVQVAGKVDPVGAVTIKLKEITYSK